MRQSGKRWVDLALLVAIGLLVMLPAAFLQPLIDRDEPRFSRATIEMMDRGEWVVPYFNNEYRFDKPPLTYWLMRAGYGLLGAGEGGARFHSVLSTLLTALTIYGLGRRLFNHRAGLTGAFMWLVCFQIQITGRAAVADMPMILSVTLSMWAMLELLFHPDRSHRRSWRAVLWLTQIFGFLAKGPVAMAVPAVALLLCRWVLWRRPLPWRRLGLPVGVPLYLLGVGLWGIPALLQTHGAYWDEGMGNHVFDRGLETFNGRKFLPFYYPLVALISFFPWIGFGGRFVGFVKPRFRSDPAVACLLGWLLAPYLIFLCYATQLPHYVLPGFPAAFILLGGSLCNGDPIRRGWWLWMIAAFGALLGAVAGFLALTVVLRDPEEPLRMILWGGAAAFLGWSWMLAVFRGWRWSRLMPPTALLLLGVCLISFGLRTLSVTREAGRIAGAANAGNGAMLGYCFAEPSLVFYTHEYWDFTGDPEEVKAFLKEPGSRMLVLLQRETRPEDILFRSAEARESAGFWRTEHAEVEAIRHQLEEGAWELTTREGFNPGRSKWVQVLIALRPG